MAIDFDVFDDGEAITSAGMQDRMTKASAFVNNLPEEAVERESLNYHHLPSLIPTDIYTAGLNAYSPNNPVAAGVYDQYGNGLPTVSGSGYPLDYQAFGTTAPAPYGPVGAGSTDEGWRIPCFNNVIPDACLVICQNHNFDTEGLRGVIVRASLYLHDADDVFTHITIPAPTYYKDSVIIAIGWTDGGGTRHVKERSIRWIPIRSIWRGECKVSTLLTQADLDSEGGDGTVSSIFMVVARGTRGGDPLLPEHPNPNQVGVNDMGLLAIGEYNITLWPLHAGTLTEL